MPANVTINARKNANWIKAFQYLAGGVGVVMTGGRLVLQVREAAANHRAYINLSSDVGGGIEITAPTLGKFTITFPLVALEAMAARDGYVHDLLFERADGVILTIWEGAFNLGNGVTR